MPSDADPIRDQRAGFEQLLISCRHEIARTQAWMVAPFEFLAPPVRTVARLAGAAGALDAALRTVAQRRMCFLRAREALLLRILESECFRAAAMEQKGLGP